MTMGERLASNTIAQQPGSLEAQHGSEETDAYRTAMKLLETCLRLFAKKSGDAVSFGADL